MTINTEQMSGQGAGSVGMFKHRKIDVTVKLGQGTFGEKDGDTVTLSGFRVSAMINVVAAQVQGEAQVRISGLSMDHINKLTGPGPGGVEIRNNTLVIAAGDVGGVMSTVFTGKIIQSFGDFQGAPDVALNIVALGAAVEALRPISASSYRGAVDVATIMADLAKQMGQQPQGLAFENHGVSVMLSNPYLPGTAWQQASSAAEAAGINFSVENGKLVIWPGRGYRKGDPILLSAETGLIGYPAFGGLSTIVNHLYLPDIAVGKRVQIKSEITVACGVWIVQRVTHVLQAETPGGQWMTQLMCARVSQ